MQAALAAGYTAKQILNFMSRLYPSFSKSIKNAATVGYTAEQLVRFLGDNKITNLDRFGKGQSSGEPYPGEPYENTTNPFIKAAEVGKKQAETPSGVKTAGTLALGLGLAGLGAYAMNKYRNRALHPNEILGPEQIGYEGNGNQGSQYDIPQNRIGNDERPIGIGTDQLGEGPIPRGYQAKLELPLPKKYREREQPEAEENEAIEGGYNQRLALPSPDQAGREQLQRAPKGGIPLGFQRKPFNQQPWNPLNKQESEEKQENQQILPSQPPTKEAKSKEKSITKQEKISPKDLFDQLEVSDQIKNMATSSKNTAEDIAEGIKAFFLKPSQLKWLKSQTDEPLDSLVERFLKESKDPAATESAATAEIPRNSQVGTPKINQQPDQRTSEPPVDNLALDNAPQPDLSQSKDLTEESKPQESGPMSLEDKKREFVPGKHVMMPDGSSGFISDVRGDIAYVKVGSKVKTRKLEDLEDSPLTEEQIGNLWDQLNRNLPKGAKSSQISYVGYNEESNELSYLPHGGTLYTFENIPKEFAEKLKSMQHLAKTTGGNLISSWVEGEKSRGAGMSELIAELRALRQAKNPGIKVSPHDKKDSKLFSHHDYAEKASKKNEKRRKELAKAEAKKKKGKS